MTPFRFFGILPPVMCKCLHPVEAWICGYQPCKSDGVVSPHLVFNEREARHYFYSVCPSADFFRQENIQGRMAWVNNQLAANLVLMPCGKCAACQIQKRKDMSVRLAHEASQYEDSCFITLTYDEDNVPKTEDGDKTLLPSDVQKFMKRLRRHLEYVPKKVKGIRDHVGKVRYFAVGEYGGKTHRPHYHLIIFGWKPSDAELFKTHNGRPVFRSAQIEKLWPFGFSTFSEVSPYVAKYCARYVTKKFARLDSALPRDKKVVPEFVLQSTRHGAIGSTWFDRYGVDACKCGLCTLRVNRNVQKCSIPQYYWRRLRRYHLPVWLKCRDDKIAFLTAHPRDIDVDALERSVECFRYRMLQEVESEYF